MLFWSTRTDISKSSAKTLAMFVTAANESSLIRWQLLQGLRSKTLTSHVRKSLDTYRALRIIRFSPNEQPETTPVFYISVMIQHMCHI